jgi:hypothetical protein
MEVGTRVQFSVAHLRNTGQYTGEAPPTNFGPFARGKIDAIRVIGPGLTWARVLWDNGIYGNVNILNLEERRSRASEV